MKQEQTIPPGIIAFKNHGGYVKTLRDAEVYHNRVIEYDEWVRSKLYNPHHDPYTIWTIEVNGQRFSVEDKVRYDLSKDGIIAELKYNSEGWWAKIADAWNRVLDLYKLPTPPSRPEAGNMDEQQYRELTYEERKEWNAKFKISRPEPLTKEEGELTERIKKLVFEDDFKEWRIKEGWQYHNDGHYWYKLEYRSQWPPLTKNVKESAELEAEFLQQYESAYINNFLSQLPSQPKEGEERDQYSKGYLQGISDSYTKPLHQKIETLEAQLSGVVEALRDLIPFTETMMDAGDYKEEAYPTMHKRLKAAKAALTPSSK